MKILHLMRDEKFTKPISEFYDQFFNNGEHEICYINVKGNASLIDLSLTLPQHELYLSSGFDIKGILALRKMILRYDYVVLHSLFLSDYVQIAFIFDKRVLDRLVWLEWGFDLYAHPKNRSGFINKLKDYIGNRIRNNCNSFIAIFPPDIDVYREKYPNSKVSIYNAWYSGIEITDYISKYSSVPNLELHKGKPVCIQIGHYASYQLNHFEALDALAKYKDEKIKIIIPLSYGDPKYANEVAEYANNIFGEKVVCLKDFMPLDKYIEIMSSVDIAIFNTYRQIGLGNINTMISSNVKFYMPKNSVMYTYFTQVGVPVQAVEDLQKESFGDFSMPVFPLDEEKVKKYLSNLSDINFIVNQWDYIYKDFAKRIRK